MDITINKENVFKSVVMNVSVVARSLYGADGNSLYDKARIQERDKDVLELQWNSAYSSLLKILDNFLTGYTETTLIIDDKRRFNPNVLNDISENVESILVNRITSEWMKLKAVEYAPGYANLADSGTDDLMKKIRVKAEPALKQFNV